MVCFIAQRSAGSFDTAHLYECVVKTLVLEGVINRMKKAKAVKADLEPNGLRTGW